MVSFVEELREAKITMPNETLTICIPTTLNRETIFNTLKSIKREIQNLPVILEIFVNLKSEASHEQTKRLQRLQKAGYTLNFHPTFLPTAESSALTAAKSATGSWVWIVGDDDVVMPRSVSHVLQLIENTSVDFWLLNFIPKVGRLKTSYIDIGPKPIQISNGLAVWKKLGFASATTTLSVFLIRKKIIDLEVFRTYHEISGIYSHSVALLHLLAHRNVGVTDFKCLLRNEEDPLQIETSINNYERSNTLGSIYFFQLEGLFSLLTKLSRELQISLEDLLLFREIELIKDSSFGTKKQKVLVSNTGNVMLRALRLRDTKLRAQELPSTSFNITKLSNEFHNEPLILETPVRVSIH
jgi:hypothetical protein